MNVLTTVAGGWGFVSQSRDPSGSARRFLTRRPIGHPRAPASSGPLGLGAGFGKGKQSRLSSVSDSKGKTRRDRSGGTGKQTIPEPVGMSQTCPTPEVGGHSITSSALVNKVGPDIDPSPRRYVKRDRPTVQTCNW
jgi:hypothetical protein